MWSLGKQVKQLKSIKAGTTSVTNELSSSTYFYEIWLQIGPSGIPGITSLRPLHVTVARLGQIMWPPVTACARETHKWYPHLQITDHLSHICVDEPAEEPASKVEDSESYAFLVCWLFFFSGHSMVLIGFRTLLSLFEGYKALFIEWSQNQVN